MPELSVGVFPSWRCCAATGGVVPSSRTQAALAVVGLRTPARYLDRFIAAGFLPRLGVR